MRSAKTTIVHLLLLVCASIQRASTQRNVPAADSTRMYKRVYRRQNTQRYENAENTKIEVPKKTYKLGIVSTYKPTICGIAEFTDNMINGFEKSRSNMKIEVFNLVRHAPKPLRKYKNIKIQDIMSSPATEADEFTKVAEYVSTRDVESSVVTHHLSRLRCF